jgi:hypothetical protein
LIAGWSLVIADSQSTGLRPMPARQLQINLWEQLQAATADPLACDFQQLCLMFDRTIAELSQRDRLQAGATAIQQLADLLAIRAESYFDAWQQRYDPMGPVLEEDAIAALVRQSFFLDLDELMTEPEVRFCLPSEYGGGDSVVGAIAKEALLEWLEESEVEGQDVSSEHLEDNEDVSTWIGLVRAWMDAGGLESVTLLELIQGVELSRVEVWMAALLGGFELQQTGEFYSVEGGRSLFA